MFHYADDSQKDSMADQSVWTRLPILAPELGAMAAEVGLRQEAAGTANNNRRPIPEVNLSHMG